MSTTSSIDREKSQSKAAVLSGLSGSRPSRHTETALVGAITVLAGVVAALSGNAPTGQTSWDAILAIALASVVVIAASKAPRWSIIFFCTVGAATAGLGPWGAVAFFALVLGVASALLTRRSRSLSALAAALTIQVLLRIPAFGFFGLPSLVAAVACVPILTQGYRYGTKRARKMVRWGLGGLLLLLVLLLLVGGATLINARIDVNRGVSAARRGLQAARSGDTAQVAFELEEAESALVNAERRVSSLPARVLRLVPVAAQHHRSISIAVEQGAVIAREAGAAVREADIESISLTAGSVDLAALRQMAPRLRSTAESLAVASERITASQSPWLLPIVTDRIDELLDEVSQLQPETELAADAAEIVPGLLGADRPQTYFVMFGTPAESRELGGFLGSWALISFDNGRLQLGESGRVRELYSIAESAVIAPGTVSDWYLAMARPTEFPQNLTSSPDFSNVAAVSRDVLAGLTAEPIDGFVYLDAAALVSLLELTGPVQIPFQEESLDSDNAARFFFRDQYLIEGLERNEIFGELAAVASAVLERISAQTLPGPEELGRVLGPVARAGRLQVVTFDENQNDFLRSVKLLRDFGRVGAQDFVALAQTNGLSNKMDLYLHRELDYRVQGDVDGTMQVTATVTLTSIIPPDAPELTLGFGETKGENYVLLSLYSPHSLTTARLNGQEVELRSTVEFGLPRYLIEVTVPPSGQPMVVEFDLVGSWDTSGYSLTMWHQPLVNTDQVSVSYRGSDGSIAWSGPLVENLNLAVTPPG